MSEALVDIGANLTHESFKDDLAAVLTRATAACVETMIVTGSTVTESARAAALARRHPERLRATAGVHPHHADDIDTAGFAALRALARTPEVVAIGETGLDFFRDFCPRAAQELAFERHLALAAELGMPLFLHERDAWPRFAEILRPWRHRLGAVVVHCFTGGREALHDYIDLDCHIGITGWICDERRGGHLPALLPSIPANRLMLETDAPNLMPRTIRPRPKTRRNEPAMLPHVLATVADALAQPPEVIARQTTATARAFFRLDEPRSAARSA